MTFQTLREDGRSLRDIAVEFFKDKPPQTVVPYTEIGKVLGIAPTSQMLRQVVRSALKPLLNIHRRGLSCVRGTGYRILRASEHMIVANGHRSKADRAMQRAITFLEGAKREEMNDIERQLHDGQVIIMQTILVSHRHLDSRIKRIELLLQGNTTIQHRPDSDSD